MCVVSSMFLLITYWCILEIQLFEDSFVEMLLSHICVFLSPLPKNGEGWRGYICRFQRKRKRDPKYSVCKDDLQLCWILEVMGRAGSWQGYTDRHTASNSGEAPDMCSWPPLQGVCVEVAVTVVPWKEWALGGSPAPPCPGFCHPHVRRAMLHSGFLCR